MTEIRCPMCGKPNSDQLEVCQFCGARLKPLIFSSQADDAASPLPAQSTDAPAQRLPDWLSSMRGDSTETAGGSSPEDESEAQGWLERIRDESDPQEDLLPRAESVAPLEAESSAPEDDDWLQRIRALHRDDQQEPQEISEPEPEEGKPSGWAANFILDKDKIDADENGVPDWLESFRDERGEIASEEDVPAVEGDLPDWLHAEVTESAPVAATGEGDPPGWLNGEDEEIAPEPAMPTVEADLPDWVSDLGGGDEPVSAPPLKTDDLPDWFTDPGDEKTPLFGEPEADLPTLAEEEETPDWVASRLASGVAPFVIDEEFDDNLLDVDRLPDWLAGKSEDQDIEDSTESSDLAPAELPGWLEAMRPVETSTPGAVLDDYSLVESVGPLAGLRSVLPAEPGIDRMKKPPTYSVKLQVTESQQAHAALLEELLTNEGQALPIAPPPRLSSQRILRWLIALILSVAIGFVVAAGSTDVPLPNQADLPAETFAASKLVSALSADAPVLVAFEYEPGMSGEMNAAAAAVVDHLMLQGARLTLVSTSPTGPAVAEYFLRHIEAKHKYVSGVQYINLGYIPGGAAGLRGFAEMPRLITTLSFDGVDPWGTPPLHGVEAISDFTLVVVITDDSDTARTWIEQVQPKLGNTPFIAVISAQVGPMVRPYYSAQVQGMVTGLMGGAAYEQTMGQGSYNLARVYWDAFSIGLILAVAAILVGGAVNIISVLLAHKKGTKGEAV